MSNLRQKYTDEEWEELTERAYQEDLRNYGTFDLDYIQNSEKETNDYDEEVHTVDIYDVELNQFIMIKAGMQIIVNKSGYPHAPYLVTWINAYEQCGAEILTREQLKEKYKI